MEVPMKSIESLVGRWTPLAALALLAACSQPEPEMPAASDAATPAPAPTSTAVAYEGARLLLGDGRVIENGTFVVDNGEFTAVGAAGSVNVPAGAAVVNLAGRTVMPTILDAHVHTRNDSVASLEEDLRRRAVFGVSGAMSMGRDDDDALLALRGNEAPGLARFYTAGRGISRPEPGRPTEPHWVDTPDQAREAARTEVGRGVDIVKVWVDDRNGQYPKITPELYGAIIDETHRLGGRVSAHIWSLEDGKGLVSANLDVFAHGVRDRDIDDEFVQLVRNDPDLIMIPNLPERGEPTDLSYVEGIMPADEVARLQAENTTMPELHDAFGIQARNLARLTAETDLRIAMGTDGNVYWGAHIEMEDMVVAGMSTADVIVAATSNAAAAMGIDDAGTIEAGKRADFLVLEANPLDDITNTRRIVDVYLLGTAVDRRI
jgi:imidazolonepropionase-like amidohydrolase